MADKVTERHRDLVVFAFAGAIFLLSARFISAERGFVLFEAFSVFYVLITQMKLWWEEARFWWFVGVLSVIHVIAIFAVEMPPHLKPALAAAPFAIMDYFAMNYLIKRLIPISNQTPDG